MKTDFIIQKMMEYYNTLTMKELAQKQELVNKPFRNGKLIILLQQTKKMPRIKYL